MAVLALMLPDAAASARFATALGSRHDVIQSPSWRHLLQLVKRRPVDLCVVDLYDPVQSLSISKLQRLRRRHEGLAIVVYSDFVGRESDLFELGRIRVDGVLQASGCESRREIRSAVDWALARAAASRVVRRLGARLPDFALDVLGWSVEYAEDKPTVDAMTRALGTSPRTLGRDLRKEELPTPRQFLVWGRLLQATRLLESSGATVEAVAYRLGYATGGALRRALKRNTGHPPSELIRRGGLTAALEAFIDQLVRPTRRTVAPRRRRPGRRHWARVGA